MGEFDVAVLEKVAKLEDNDEELAGLVEDAQGRRALCLILTCLSDVKVSLITSS